jgi:hypothetical protein
VALMLTVVGAICGYCEIGSEKRQQAAEHDHDGDDPGEDRPFDEEA